MNPPFGHHALFNRYRFEGTLVLDTALRLSSGRASDRTDAPLMRTRAGLPFIPGSSLRGAIRSAVERIVIGAGSAAALRSCTLFAPDDCNQRARSLWQSGDPDDADLTAFAQRDLCDVCKLFGASMFAARLLIGDAYPVQSRAELDKKTTIRDGVGIDRDTGTAAEGVKFDYEVLETGPKFGLRMQAENVTDTDRLLINLIGGLLASGLHVGGKRAAGLGRIHLEGAWTVSGFETPEALWSALSRGENPHNTLTWEGR